MAGCCSHADDEHEKANICTEQIHYPSEDYPCLCDGFVRDADGVCTACGHKSDKHAVTRRCVPRSGEECDCIDTMGR